MKPLFERLDKNYIYYILILGFTLRLFFFFFGADAYYGKGQQYINTDSYSYTLSAINLIEKGTLTFNFDNEEAYYGRLPGYPLFWGIHYYLFGAKYVYIAVAVSQLVLDTISIWLIFFITLNLSKKNLAANITALLLACYPFILVWNTMTATEVLATFLSLLFFYWLYCKKTNIPNLIILGIILALAFYVREYLGILIISGYLYLYLNNNKKKFIEYSVVVSLSFGLIYIMWPIRNYLLFNKIIPIKTVSAGYDLFATDVHSARAWMHGWTNEVDPYLDQIAFKKGPVQFPPDIFPNETDYKNVQLLIKLARECGSGTYTWRTSKRYIESNNCNAQIAEGYQILLQNFKKEFPFRYYTEVPLKNFKKAFFKNKLITNTVAGEKSNSSKAGNLTVLLFSYRSILLLLAFVGILFNGKLKSIYPIVFFISFIYIMICVLLRQVEMRYLIQADVLSLIFAGLLLGKNIYPYLEQRRIKINKYQTDIKES